MKKKIIFKKINQKHRIHFFIEIFLKKNNDFKNLSDITRLEMIDTL